MIFCLDHLLILSVFQHVLQLVQLRMATKMHFWEYLCIFWSTNLLCRFWEAIPSESLHAFQVWTLKQDIGTFEMTDPTPLVQKEFTLISRSIFHLAPQRNIIRTSLFKSYSNSVLLRFGSRVSPQLVVSQKCHQHHACVALQHKSFTVDTSQYMTLPTRGDIRPSSFAR